MDISDRLHTALDELRMQMLGAEVMLGFQFGALFQWALGSPSDRQIGAIAAGFAMIVLTLGLLISVPSMHRLSEDGEATTRILRISQHFADIALVCFAGAMASNVFLITEIHWGFDAAKYSATATLFGCALAWFVLGWGMRRRVPKQLQTMERTGSAHTSVRARIDCLLTEARVILPGAQALLGFQFIVTLMEPFARMPVEARVVHFAALACVTLSVLLLLSSAAIHRVAFGGADDPRFLRIGSFVVTLALMPLALGIALDMYVAAVKVFGTDAIAIPVGVGALVLLSLLWYLLPLALKARNKALVGDAVS